MAFRGASAAQDSTIPALDNAFGIEYPKNALTKYLYELRMYRPKPHRDYLDSLVVNFKKHNVKAFTIADSYSSFYMLQNVYASYKFRHQHWNMTKKYIIDNTNYPRATGGTPITTWLPNQIGACLENCQ